MSDIWLVIGTVIFAVIGVVLLAFAFFTVDRNTDRRDHAQGR